MTSTSTTSRSKAKKTSNMLVKGVKWTAPNFKLVPAITESLDPSGAQSRIPSKVLLINDIRTHFKCTIQELGTLEMDNALSQLCVDKTLKPEHRHLEIKGLTHIPHLPRNFQVKWIRYVLSRVHDGKLWLDQPILITKKMIHRITGLPMSDKAKSTKTLSRDELQELTLAEWDGRGLKINNVSDVELKFGIIIIAYKLYSSSRLNSVACEAVDLAYKVVKKNMDFDLAEVLLTQFNKNMDSIRTSKNNPCKFGSLLICIFFYVQNFFPSKGTVVWRKHTPILYQINEFIAEIGQNFETVMDNYFEEFKDKMDNRFRIPPKLVKDYKDDICFMVDCDKVYIQAAIPRVAWVKPLPYEINIDEARDIIEALINEPAIPNTPAFGTYDEAKARIELEIKLPKAITSTKRKAAKTEETEEESEEEAETPKKKGKVVITKPKPRTAVFTRRTRKGQKESEVVFRRPPPTFEEKLKQLEQGSGMSNFKALKYESRSDAEKMQIEELLLNKMGKWKYTPDDISSQIPNELLVRIRPRWTSAVQTVKDIYAQTLKQLLPNLTYKEVKEALKENEHQMTLRFHTFLVLSKQIEAIVNNATTVWKRIYNLPMPSDPTVTIEGDKDDEEDEEEKEEEEADEEEGDTVIIDDEEGDMVIIGDEEDDPEQVAAEVIASLPHSPQKGVASSASASRIVSTVATSIAQSLPITSQL